MDGNGKNRSNDPERGLRTDLQVARERKEVSPSDGHVVFDFTGLHRPDVTDLALILTARLQTPAHESVWVRALDPRTHFVLRALGLDHLFRHYPGGDAMH